MQIASVGPLQLKKNPPGQLLHSSCSSPFCQDRGFSQSPQQLLVRSLPCPPTSYTLRATLWGVLSNQAEICSVFFSRNKKKQRASLAPHPRETSAAHTAFSPTLKTTAAAAAQPHETNLLQASPQPSNTNPNNAHDQRQRIRQNLYHPCTSVAGIILLRQLLQRAARGAATVQTTIALPPTRRSDRSPHGSIFRTPADSSVATIGNLLHPRSLP